MSFFSSLLVLIALMGVTSGLWLNSRCGRGRQYWCKSYSNAKKCDKVAYCHFASRLSPQPLEDSSTSSAGTCAECLKFIDDLKAQFTNASVLTGEETGYSMPPMKNTEPPTQAKFEQLFIETVCTEIPQPLHDTCQMLVKQYVPLFAQMIVSMINAKPICQDLGMCPSDTALRFQSHEDLNNAPCKKCANIIRLSTRQLTSHQSIKHLRPRFDDFCQGLSLTERAVCTIITRKHLRKVVNQLTEIVTPDLMCPKPETCLTTAVKNSQPIRYKDAATCEVCTMAMSYLESVLKENSTEADIKKYLDELCDHLPASVSKECLSLVDTYSDEILKLLIDKVKPAEVCKLLHLCTSLRYRNSQAIGFKGTGTCEVCTMAMEYLESVLKQNETREEIKKYLDEMCAHLPTSISKECLGLVDAYSNEIINLLIDGLKPDEICKVLRLCSSTRYRNTQVTQPIRFIDDVTCEVCTMAMEYLESVLKQNETEEEIKKYLDEMCAHLPTSISKECLGLVDAYSDEIINLLIDGLKPDEICKALHLCSSTRYRKLKNVRGGMACEVCEVMITKLDMMLGENSTRVEIEQALDHVCSYLPEKYAQECNSLVAKYYGTIVDLITSVPAEVVCNALGVCSSFNHLGREGPNDMAHVRNIDIYP